MRLFLQPGIHALPLLARYAEAETKQKNCFIMNVHGWPNFCALLGSILMMRLHSSVHAITRQADTIYRVSTRNMRVYENE
jgi:hypothetical protein